MKFRFAFFLPILLVGTNSHAQWKTFSTNDGITPFFPRIQSWLGPLGCGGAITFKDGILWAGYNELSYSLDTGKHWFPTSLRNIGITDISFINRDTGAVAADSVIFVTHNGGKTWTSSPGFQPFCSSVYFDPNTKYILVNVPGGVTTPYSPNGGGWWYFGWSNDLFPGAYNGNDLVVTRRGSVFLFTAANAASYYPISLTILSYNSSNWYQAFGEIGSDTYSLGLDSCSSSTVYAVQENYYSQNTGDPNSDICLSTNAGQQWTYAFSHPAPYLAGSFTSARHAQYAGTVANGILRSTDHGQSWQNIGGPSNKPDCRCLFAIDDNLIVALDSLGNFWRTDNSGGDSVVASDDRYFPLTDSLFFHDTIACDTPKWQVVQVHSSSCSSPVLSTTFQGRDVINYSGGPDGSSNGEISIGFTPRTVGLSSAMFIITLYDGTSDTIFLSGVNLGSKPFAMTPDSIFLQDTIRCAAQIERPVYFHYSNCGNPTKISSLSLAGSDAHAYTLHDQTADSVLVDFQPVNAGPSYAMLIAHLDDGSSDTISLQSYYVPSPFRYSSSSSALFSNDTLTSCDAPITDTLIFTFSGCAANIVSQIIAGAGSADYSMSRTLSSPLHTPDTVIISFKPTSVGDRSGVLQFSFDDGTAITIPLKGWAIGPHAVTLRTSDESTDTLGGTITVPIEVAGLNTSQAMHLVIHYEGTMDYLGSFSQSQVRLDLPNEQWAGRSKLLITAPATDGMAGFATFTVFNDSLIPTRVTFDSMEFVEAVQPCVYDLHTDAVSNIIAPSDCGATTLSRWVHLGVLPDIRISPNPTDGDIQISSVSDVGPVILSIFDLLGSPRFEEHAVLKASLPLSVSMPNGDGIYYLRLESSGGVRSFQVIVNR